MRKRDEASRTVASKLLKYGWIVAAGAVLTACAGTPDCLKGPRYANASAFPKLKSPAGLQVPANDPDMQIPSVSTGPVAAYATAPTGTEQDNPQSRCLTTPPPLQASN